MKSKSDIKYKNMLLEIIEEMGFDVDMAEFNRQWKRRRTALLEQWCEIAAPVQYCYFGLNDYTDIQLGRAVYWAV